MTDFDRIYERYYPIVYKFTLSLCRDASLAEEITLMPVVEKLSLRSVYSCQAVE